MIYKKCFNVEGSLYCEEQTLRYNGRRVITLKTKQGDRKDYESTRRTLYRYRDKILEAAKMLDKHNFEVREK